MQNNSTMPTKEIDQGILRYSLLIEKLVLSKLFWLIVVVFGLSIPIVKTLKRELPKPLPVLGRMGDFNLKNQFNKNVSQQDFLGKVVITNLIFTSCPSTCPEMSRKMQVIQKRVRGLGQAISLLSISVDPKNDTPLVLEKYAKDYKANPYIWSFLTGEESELKKLILDQLKLSYISSTNLFEITHSEKFILVDSAGNVRGYYDSDQVGINQLMIDTGLLVNNAFNHKEEG